MAKYLPRKNQSELGLARIYLKTTLPYNKIKYLVILIFKAHVWQDL